MRLLLTKPVYKWLSKEKYIQEEDLILASDEVISGVYEASLGGSLFKKRISNSSNQGKSGGSRLIVGYKKDNNFFFMYVFNKNETDNISEKEKQILKERAKLYFSFDDNAIDQAIKAEIFYEIN